MKKFLILIIALFAIYGCEKKDQVVNDKSKIVIPDTSTNTLKPVLYKGMYHINKNQGGFSECESGKTFLISNESETSVIDSVYMNFKKNDKNRKLFISVEGFNSVRERPRKSGFDTMLVITRIIGIDTTFSCD